MGIKSTTYIERNDAIDRIKKIHSIFLDKNYIELDENSNESYYDVAREVMDFENFDIENIEKWTNQMIEEKIDEPFFRRSMFDNYLIQEN